MRLVFMGTPDFAARCLDALIAAGHDIAAVYTRAPQPAGRGKKERKSPAHKIALERGLDVRTPKGFRKAEVVEDLTALQADAAIVVAYGVILPAPALAATRLGCFNLHASLLPRWRGAAPIQRAIMAGDATTGVQVMRMEEGLDTGPVMLSETTPICADDTFATLHDRLAGIGAELLPRFLAALEQGRIEEAPQSADGVTYAEKISPEEARIDWTRSAVEVDRHVRGLSPFPGAWAEAARDGEAVRVKALMSALADCDRAEVAPGTVLEADERLIVACGDGAVELVRLQRAGKSAQDASAFLRGFPLAPGDRL